MKLIKSNFNEYSIQTLSTAKLKEKKKKKHTSENNETFYFHATWVAFFKWVFERREEFELERQR